MLLAKDVGDHIKFTFEDGILFPGAWIVPKGNPVKAGAWSSSRRHTIRPKRRHLPCSRLHRGHYLLVVDLGPKSPSRKS